MKNNLKPFAVIPLMEGLDGKKVVEERLQYHHNSITDPLFKEWVPQRVQLPFIDRVTLASVELH